MPKEQSESSPYDDYIKQVSEKIDVEYFKSLLERDRLAKLEETLWNS